MKIRLSDISAEGLHIKDTLSLESLNKRMSEGRESGIVFTMAPDVDIKIVRTADGAETKGSVKSKYRQPCGLCAVEIDKDVEVEANFILRRKSQDAALQELEDDEDIGIVYYENDTVDLEDVIQESLILTLSLYWHPPEDESGACVRCGKKFESDSEKKLGSNLGTLFKKAGLN